MRRIWDCFEGRNPRLGGAYLVLVLVEMAGAVSSSTAWFVCFERKTRLRRRRRAGPSRTDENLCIKTVKR